MNHIRRIVFAFFVIDGEENSYNSQRRSEDKKKNVAPYDRWSSTGCPTLPLGLKVQRSDR